MCVNVHSLSFILNACLFTLVVVFQLSVFITVLAMEQNCATCVVCFRGHISQNIASCLLGDMEMMYCGTEGCVVMASLVVAELCFEIVREREGRRVRKYM